MAFPSAVITTLEAEVGEYKNLRKSIAEKIADHGKYETVVTLELDGKSVNLYTDDKSIAEKLAVWVCFSASKIKPISSR